MYIIIVVTRCIEIWNLFRFKRNAENIEGNMVIAIRRIVLRDSVNVIFLWIQFVMESY